MTLLVPLVPRSRSAAPALPSAGPAIRLHVDFRQRPVRLVLAGELDLVAAEMLRPVLSSLLDGNREHLVVDLAAVTFADCAGLAPLVAAERTAAATGCVLELQGHSRPFARLVAAAPHLWPSSWRTYAA